MKPYTEELVYITSEDGVSLEGVVIRPAVTPARLLAVVWMHGFTGHFDERHNIAIGRQVAARGFTFISGNNRGHHLGAGLQRRDGQPLLGGAWWEIIEEAPFDIGGWVSFAVSMGHAGVVIAGHSLGAGKVTQYQALRQDPRVTAMVLASPPVLNFTQLARSDPKLLNRALRLIAEGRGEELIPSPLGWSMSAQTYASWIRANPDTFGTSTPQSAISRIRCPMLVVYGTNEAEIMSAAGFEIIQRSAVATPRLDNRVIEGADHVYTGHEDEVGVAVADWLETIDRQLSIPPFNTPTGP